MTRIAPSNHEPVVPEDRRAFRSKDIAAAMERQDYRCAWCPAPLKGFHCDHVLPRDLGGQTTLANLQLMCPPCHRRKTDEDIARIAKARRLRTPRKAPKRPMQNRGFPKNIHRHFSGQVTHD